MKYTHVENNSDGLFRKCSFRRIFNFAFLGASILLLYNFMKPNTSKAIFNAFRECAYPKLLPLRGQYKEVAELLSIWIFEFQPILWSKRIFAKKFSINVIRSLRWMKLVWWCLFWLQDPFRQQTTDTWLIFLGLILISINRLDQ